jgi:hypothetical protein
MFVRTETSGTFISASKVVPRIIFALEVKRLLGRFLIIKIQIYERSFKMEDKRNLTEEEKELSKVWESESSLNFFGCGQYSNQ